MVESIEGRRIIVTGAAGGIGAGVVKGLARYGVRMAAIYNRTEPAGDLSNLAAWHRCDLSKKTDVAATFDRIAADLGGLDALVNVAGLWRGDVPQEVDDEHIDFLIGMNLKSAIYTNQAAFRLMKDKGGRIINFGSVEGVDGSPISAVYASAKGAVHAWTRSVARGWGKYGITVNILAPAMDTKPYQRIRDAMTEEQLAHLDNDLLTRIPIGGKMGDAEHDCAPVIAFLVSEASHFITGQVIPVDGGLLMVGA